MTKVVPTSSSMRVDWKVPAALVILSLVPLIAGIVRLTGLAKGGPVTPENARFFAAPVPVILHILGATLFCVVGAFQFSGALRRRHPGWHRSAGRVLVACGLIAGLSGLWMTVAYPLYPQLQGDLLYGFRLLFGSAMVFSILWSLAAILRRDIAQHRAWLMRAYAIGQGAGTQVLVTVPWMLIWGTPGGLARDLLMGAAWVINLVLAEWLIRRPV